MEARCAEPLIAIADADHVHRIVANLVRNAARAIREQTGRTERRPDRARASSARADRAVIEIADNGPGVPDAVVGRLFQPFAGPPRAAAQASASPSRANWRAA